MASLSAQKAKKRITAKDIICLPANILSSWIDTINPKNIAKRYAKSIKENKAVWVIALAIIAFIVIRIAFMDFDLSSLGINNSMFCGGKTGDIETRLKVSDKLNGDGIESFYNTMKPIGIALSVLFWMIMLVGISVRDQFTVEQIAIHMIRLILPVWLINDKGFYIMQKLLSIGESIAHDLSTQWIVDTQLDGAGDVKVSLFNIINALLPLFVLWLAAIACQLVCWLTCFGRRIKLEVLVAFAPIALSDVTGDSHSTSMRYCRTVLAIALQGALILGVGFIANKVLEGIYQDPHMAAAAGTSLTKLIADGQIGFFDCLPAVGVALTVIGLFPKTEELAKTVIGA